MRPPPSQRSPEVAAFIECCQLQRELAKGQWQGYSTHQEMAIADFKFTRANMIGPTPICCSFPVFMYAWERLKSAAEIPEPRPPGAVGSRIMALLDSDLSIDTLLLVTVGVKMLSLRERQKARLLPVYSSIVAKMRIPEVANILRQELDRLQANLPQRLLSYEELLASKICQAFHDAAALPAVRPTADADIASTFRELLERAQQQGNNMTLATCGYQLAAVAPEYGAWAYHRQAGQAGCSSDGSQVVVPPSAFLSWLKRAKQAHARCKAVLPIEWIALVKGRQQAPLVWKPWLQRQQRERDCWQAPAAAEVVEYVQKMGYGQWILWRTKVQPAIAAVVERRRPTCVCAVVASNRECQRAAWPVHKSLCKAHQQKEEAQCKG
ncbi:hypothetical protein N2152v2_007620 [Parachlorella kessleri]